MGEGRPDPQGGREEGMLSLEEESFLLREIGLVSRGIGGVSGLRGILICTGFVQSDGIDIKMVGRGLGASGKGEVMKYADRTSYIFQ